MAVMMTGFVRMGVAKGIGGRHGKPSGGAGNSGNMICYIITCRPSSALHKPEMLNGQEKWRTSANPAKRPAMARTTEPIT